MARFPAPVLRSAFRSRFLWTMSGVSVVIWNKAILYVDLCVPDLCRTAAPPDEGGISIAFSPFREKCAQTANGASAPFSYRTQREGSEQRQTAPAGITRRGRLVEREKREERECQCLLSLTVSSIAQSLSECVTILRPFRKQSVNKHKAADCVSLRLLPDGPEGDRTLEPHGCEPCALPAELRARIRCRKSATVLL